MPKSFQNDVFQVGCTLCTILISLVHRVHPNVINLSLKINNIIEITIC